MIGTEHPHKPGSRRTVSVAETQACEDGTEKVLNKCATGYCTTEKEQWKLTSVRISVQTITTKLTLERNTSPSIIKYLKCVHLYRKASMCTVYRFQSDMSVVLGHHG